MRCAEHSLLLLLGATILLAKLVKSEFPYRRFLTLKEQTLLEFLAREGDVSELMADVSEGVDPPKFVDGLICYTCYNCENAMEVYESPAICNECFEKISSKGNIIRGCNVDSRTACITDDNERMRCCKSDYCNGARQLHVHSTFLLILGITATKSLLECRRRILSNE